MKVLITTTTLLAVLFLSLFTPAAFTQAQDSDVRVTDEVPATISIGETKADDETKEETVDASTTHQLPIPLLPSLVNPSDMPPIGVTDETTSVQTPGREPTLTDHATDRVSLFRRTLANLISVVIARMEAAVDRIYDIALRLESRIATIEKDHGVNLTEAKQLVDEAETHADSAAGNIREAVAIFDDLLSSVDSTLSASADGFLTSDLAEPHGHFEKIAELLRAAKDDLMTARALLVEAVEIIRVALGLHTDVVDDSAAATDTEE